MKALRTLMLASVGAAALAAAPVYAADAPATSTHMKAGASAGGSASTGTTPAAKEMMKDAKQAANEAKAKADKAAQKIDKASSAMTTAHTDADASGKVVLFNDPTLSVSDIEGENVVNGSGEDVGDIDSIVSDGNKLYAVVGVGGFLGIGDHDVVIPLDKFERGDDQMVLRDMTRDQLKAMPDYDESARNKYHEVEDGAVGNRMAGATGTMAGSSVNKAPMTGTTAGDTNGSMTRTTADAHASGNVVLFNDPSVKLSDVEGQDVENAQGDDLGDVDSIVSDGTKLYAVVGVGGFLGIGDRDVVIPLDQFERGDDRLVLRDMTKDQLKALPEYDDSARNKYHEVKDENAGAAGMTGTTGMSGSAGTTGTTGTR